MTVSWPYLACPELHSTTAPPLQMPKGWFCCYKFVWDQVIWPNRIPVGPTKLILTRLSICLPAMFKSWNAEKIMHIRRATKDGSICVVMSWNLTWNIPFPLDLTCYCCFHCLGHSQNLAWSMWLYDLSLDTSSAYTLTFLTSTYLCSPSSSTTYGYWVSGEKRYLEATLRCRVI